MSTKNAATKAGRHGSIIVSVHDTDERLALVNGAIGVYRSDCDSAGFVAARWQPSPAHRVGAGLTDSAGDITFHDLEPGHYIVAYEHYPVMEPVCVSVQAGCSSVVCFTLGLDVELALTYETADCERSKCRQPRVTDHAYARVSFNGDADALREHVEAVAGAPWSAVRDERFLFATTVRHAGPQKFEGQLLFERRADSAAQAAGAGGGTGAAKAMLALNKAFDAEERAPAPISGAIGVSLSRSETEVTEDLPLWTLIRNSTDAMSFTNYLHFIDGLFCNDARPVRGFELDRFAKKAHRFDKLLSKRSLPFTDSDSYRVLKAATEAFVMVNCGVMSMPLAFDPTEDSAYLERRDIPPVADMANTFRDYLEPVDGAEALPYLAIIRRKLPDVPIILPHGSEKDVELCFGIVQKKLSCPCMLELIWSYWHEEGMLVQTMNAITQRFQNVRARSPNDPLANLEIDPLRPLNNLIWSYTQDEQHRLSVVRRNYEYDHHYGVRLDGKAVQGFRPADSRSKFLEAFHYLLRLCTAFYRQDDDTTVKADAFPVLNALKEVHLILSQGAHNQFGDLPSTARVEMLMQQWLLSRPEFREFLPTRIMVAYPEPWMDRVDAMKKLQNWSDTSVMHFRSLAMFGEQLLLTVRYGNWSDIYEPTQAFNWARFWRPQVQGYIHAYRAATGVDLAVDARDPAAEGTLPSILLRQRLAQQARGV
jgi:hypothetical protein